MKYGYTFTVDDCDIELEEALGSHVEIAMSGAVEIMNELLISDNVRFMLGRDNTICLVDVATEKVLKDIPQEEIMHLARELGVLQTLTVH